MGVYLERLVKVTRINCIPVRELTNSHLLAEYKELPRVFNLSFNSYKKHNGFVNGTIPPSYRMGKGHVTFFYDKLGYALQRYKELIKELETRGYNLNYDMINSIFRAAEMLPNPIMRQWQPTQEAMEINRKRIQERLSG
jgi:deoxyribonuclease (pyrimidine dimer)